MEAAVVTTSHGAMGSLIAKLRELNICEPILLLQARRQILHLRDVLVGMHDLLNKISDTENPDEQDKHWAKEVRELSYDIEDNVSELLLRVERESSNKLEGFMGFINRRTMLLMTMNIQHEFAKEFEGLTVRVVQVRERRLRYQQNDVVAWLTKTTIGRQIDYQRCSARTALEVTLVDESMEPKALPLSLLEEITDSFSQYHEIGTGGFAVVYKGILETGTVAVKKLSNAYMHEKEFQREVQCLMSVRHKNIVRFLGYCADTQGSMQLYNEKYVMADVHQRLLCFEYVPNGSLHDHITDASCGLPWRKRYQIIKGVCEGLNCLHMNGVFHLDLKPANILMDDNMEPKIADFGLSRCFDEGQSLIIASKVAGTPAYLPPEYDSQAVTRLYDIYSLGVIITETLTGKRGYYAIEDVLDSWRNRLEESLEYTELEQIRVCASIGKKCTKTNPEKRPRSVQDIIDRLKATEGAEESSLETTVISFSVTKTSTSMISSVSRSHLTEMGRMTTHKSVGEAVPHRLLAPRDEIAIKHVENTRTVHVQEVRAEERHVEEQVSEELAQLVPLAVVPTPAMPSHVGWRRKICFRRMGDDHYYILLVGLLHRHFSNRQPDTYYCCTEHVHPWVDSEWEIELSVTFFDPILGGQRTDATFITVARRGTMEDGLADVSQQAYLKYRSYIKNLDPLDDTWELRKQVGTLQKELWRTQETLKRTRTQCDDLNEELGRPRIFDEILDDNKK